MGDSDDENFVTFGSALEPLDEDNLPRKKAVTIEDQYAVDAQGRRRFHGAFTGGFSAGYFNSVGTRDGWRPQQFKSSRSSKAGGVSQRVEDFMDEEDTGEFGIAPTAVRANSDFTDHGKRGAKRERTRQDNDGPIPGIPVLKELLKPVKDTVGVSLLKKMGWRPGQGIGPRVTKREKTKTRKNNEKLKIYGCSLPNQSEKSEESMSEGSESESEEILFAPDDYEPFRCNPKDNYFGIGYTGLDRRPVLSGHLNLFETPAFKLQDKNKKLSIRGQAFGVGAFEADDEDIYQRDDMSRYDFSLGPAETKNKSRWSRKNDAETSKDNCLEGFTPAKIQLERKKIFEPPELPRDFKPFHAIRKSRFYPPIEPIEISESRKKGLGRHDLNATDRSIIIGDSTKVIPKNSVEIAKNQKEEISQPKVSEVAHNIISRTLNLRGKEQIEMRKQKEIQKSKSNSWMEKLSSKSFVKGGIEGSDPSATGSLKNLQDFTTDIFDVPKNQFSQPFPTDSEKQKRFEKYVELARQGEKEKLSTLQPLSMLEWERDREKEEFEQAARLFEAETNSLKIVDSMSDKFVSIGAKEAAPSAAKTLDEQMKNAAKMKLFGKLTRQKEPWQPASLVCKRFNIPEPRTGCAKPEKQTKNKRYSVFDSLDFGGGGGGCSERFERATETSGSFKEPYIPYKVKEKIGNAEESQNTSSVFYVSDIETTTEKMRNFEASYEKIFGRQNGGRFVENLPQAGTSSDKIAVDSRRENEPESNTESANVGEITAEKTAEKKDLFKAIFLSSSEDEDEEDKEDEDDSEAVKSLLIGKTPGELNLQRNTSPPRGIFAKLDLDSLTKPVKIGEALKGGKSREEKDNEKIMEIGDEDKNTDRRVSKEPEVQLLPDMYGPVLPSKTVRNEETSGNEEATFSKDLESQKAIFKSVVVTKPGGNLDKIKGKWVERTKSKKSKKEKHKHKHKEKERSRHKHKKKDKR